jgi:hypothetical protein
MPSFATAEAEKTAAITRFFTRFSRQSPALMQ